MERHPHGDSLLPHLPHTQIHAAPPHPKGEQNSESWQISRPENLGGFQEESHPRGQADWQARQWGWPIPRIAPLLYPLTSRSCLFQSTVRLRAPTYTVLWAPAYDDGHEPGLEEYVPFGGSPGQGVSEFTTREEADRFYTALVEYETQGTWKGLVEWVKKGILTVDDLPEEAYIYRGWSGKRHPGQRLYEPPLVCPFRHRRPLSSLIFELSLQKREFLPPLGL